MSEPRRLAGGAPLSAEILYEQGMAHYQRREWSAALDYFERLQVQDPNWPGLAALIDEVRWFQQLQEVDAGAPASDAERVTAKPRRSGFARWIAPVMIVGLLAALLLWWQAGRPGLGGQLERDVLYNRGQASLAVGDHAAARAAFEQLAAIAPGDPAALEGLERAARLESLTETYGAAEDAMAAQDWAVAEENLRAVLAVDPVYANAADLLAFVQSQRLASGFFQAGMAAYDGADSETAIQQFEQLIEADPTYQRETVRELLFVLYLRDAEALLAEPDADQDTVRRAIARYGKALGLRPRNVEAGADGQLANRYLTALQALERNDRRAAETALNAILAERPDFAGGQAAERLYAILLQRANEASAAGRDADALAALQQAAQLLVADPSAALAQLPAPSPATATPTALATVAPSPSPQPEGTPFVEVAADTLNVRLGPGTDYPVMGQGVIGQRLALVGRNDAGDWLVVCCIDEQAGWVVARLIITGSDTSLLPVGQAPTRVPTATPLPQPTAVATATPTPPVEPTPTVPPPPPPPPATATPPPR